MIDNIYQILADVGYFHPLHPALTHAPIGAVIVAFCLALTAVAAKKTALLKSAYHALLVGFIAILPTVLAGILDWQHYYAGAWIFPFSVKIPLAGLLFVLTGTTLLLGRKTERGGGLMLSFYTLCLINVMALGYLGGELVFADKKPKPNDDFQLGQQLFNRNCSGCHANGGNVIVPELPLKTSPKLKNYTDFAGFVRNPSLRNGEKGPMPDFTVDKLSDQQLQELYRYIVNKLAKP
jgi:uncharacterized membrane protein